MIIGTYISIITLNVNELNTPIKREIQKQDPYICCLRKTQGHIQTEREEMEKDNPCKWKSKKAGVAILISDKIDFKINNAAQRDQLGAL